MPSCVAENYVRHDQKGDRTVTRDAYCGGASIRRIADELDLSPTTVARLVKALNADGGDSASA
jgi:DNA-binding Lrp family transcriptional regulator